MIGCILCSRYDSYRKRDDCVSNLGENWNGLCPYQKDGCKVEDWNKEIVPPCQEKCGRHCAMSREEYAQLKGLCAYQ